MVRVADVVIDCLVKAGIKHIFLITGRGILYLSDAVAKNCEIEGISTYHEQGASYAAMAYAAASDGLSACLVSTGCAATNAVTAALCAYQDNLPVIFISGQNMLNETVRYTKTPIRTYGSQEADIVEIVDSITKYSTMLTNPSKVKYEVEKAIFIANCGRKGPTWIDIPLDIQNARVDEETLECFPPDYEIPVANDEEISTIIKKLEESSRPVLFIGGGVRTSGAIDVLKSFLTNNHIPLVYSPSAADVYGLQNDLSFGAVGSLGGSRCGNFVIQNSDLVIAIGTKLCSQTTGNFEQFARNAYVIDIDIDSEEQKKRGVRIDKKIQSDAKYVLEKLCDKTLNCDYEKWISKCKHWKEIFSVSNEKFIVDNLNKKEIDLYYLVDTLSDLICEDAIVITDAGFEELITPSTLKLNEGQRCIFPAAQGAMGYAVPAILGAYFAGKKNIVAIIGDGSFMMNMQELQIIRAYDIPVKILIINNNMYAVIRKRQKDLFRTRTIGNDPSDGVPKPDFEKIASCFGINYVKIEGNECLAQRLQEVISETGPQICEVMCRPDQPYLHTSLAINEKRKLVKRPLEDMSPFLDRDVIYDEMIVDVLDE